jgi:hypothetical protein
LSFEEHINMKYFSYHRAQYRRGQAVIIIVVLFLFISTTVVLGITNPILRQVKITKDFIAARQSYFLAEAGIEDVLFRLKNNVTTSSAETLTFDGSTVDTIITTTANGKTIRSDASVNSAFRAVETKITIGEGISFNYGVQSGNGGFIIEGGSIVNGNVYSNGDISGDGGAIITGSAVAAGDGTVSLEQSNDAPLPPTQSVLFRNTSAAQDFAQSFQVATTTPINRIGFYIKKNGGPADMALHIVNDAGGSPGTTNVLTTPVTVAASLISTSYGWIEVNLTDGPVLTPGTTYWIVLNNASQHSSSNYTMAANTGYASGLAKIGQFAGAWNNTSPAGLDGYFKIYVGTGTTATIYGDGFDYLNVGTDEGDAWAHTVNSVDTTGTVYCQVGSGNNGNVCNTSRPDPVPQPFPISDANVSTWKDQADSGTVYNGNLTVGFAGTTTGPLKINGNLSINGGGTFTMTGTVWVTGTITVTGGGKVRLASSYGTNSEVMIADSYIDISGGGAFSGSGQVGSYPLLLSTSDCPVSASCSGKNAIRLSGGAGAVVLYAQNGTLQLIGGTSAKGMTGKTIRISGGGTVSYESGLMNQNFTSGPSGGWEITSWKEVE